MPSTPADGDAVDKLPAPLEDTVARRLSDAATGADECVVAAARATMAETTTDAEKCMLAIVW